MIGSIRASIFSNASTCVGPTSFLAPGNLATSSSVSFWMAIASPVGSCAIQRSAYAVLRSGSASDFTHVSAVSIIAPAAGRATFCIVRGSLARNGHPIDKYRTDMPRSASVHVAADGNDAAKHLFQVAGDGDLL